MADGLKWAHRLRFDLAIEIEQLASGARKVTQMTSKGPVDVTAQTLVVLRERFEQAEKMMAAFGPAFDD